MTLDRVCTVCNLAKPSEAYSSSGKKRSPWCKECVNAYSASRRATLKSRSDEEVNEVIKARFPGGFKKCSGPCKELKHLSVFGRDKSQLSGVKSWCRECGLSTTHRQRDKYRSRTSEEVLSVRRSGFKVCRGCSLERSISLFSIDQTRFDGLAVRCKDCMKSYAKARSDGTRSLLIDKLVSEHGPSCLFPGCDVKGSLEIDHINPSSKGGLDEYDNYQLLCSFHNKSKGSKFIDYRQHVTKS